MNTHAFIRQITQSASMRWRLAAALSANGILIAALVAQPFIVGKIIEDITRNPGADVRLKLLLLAVLTGLAAVIAYVTARVHNAILQEIRRDSKAVLYQSILSKPLEFFEGINEGWLEAAVSTASQAARSIVNECLTVIVRALFFILLTSAWILLHHPLHGAIFLGAAAMYIHLAYRLAQNASHGIDKAVASSGNVSRQAADMLANIDSIQQNDMASREGRRMFRFLDWEKDGYRHAQQALNSNEFLQKIFLASIFIGFIASIALSLDGKPEYAIVFYIIGLLAYAQLDMVGKSLSALFEQLQKLESVLKGIQPQFHPEPNAMGCSEKHCHPVEITLEDMSFGYDQQHPIFSRFSLSFSPGSHHLISGPSGTGKSTLIRILSGQLKPQAGRVRLNDRDICTLSRADRSVLMTVISQHASLFDRSIHENATYGMADVPREQVEQLLLALKLDRLRRDGQGRWLDAAVGRNGLNLSGGEKQRILLARAILHARPLLFLDEATSALDKDTEAAVFKLLHERLPHATIVAVSHHPHAALEGYRRLSLAGTAARMAPPT